MSKKKKSRKRTPSAKQRKAWAAAAKRLRAMNAKKRGGTKRRTRRFSKNKGATTGATPMAKKKRSKGRKRGSVVARTKRRYSSYRKSGGGGLSSYSSITGLKGTAGIVTDISIGGIVGGIVSNQVVPEIIARVRPGNQSVALEVGAKLGVAAAAAFAMTKFSKRLRVPALAMVAGVLTDIGVAQVRNFMQTRRAAALASSGVNGVASLGSSALRPALPQGYGTQRAGIAGLQQSTFVATN